MQAVTHSGKFHADDVLAWALLCEFTPTEIQLTRTRDSHKIQDADIVFDVGGIYSPKQLRFDHHQNEYQGKLSSAGMILNWLFSQKFLSEKLYNVLKEQIVDYVDAVDNGIISPKAGIPCFTKIVENLNQGALSLDDFDSKFQQATNLTRLFISSLVQKENELERSKELLFNAMNVAKETNCTLIELPHYIPWQPLYFSNDGINHPTEFLMFPTIYNTWQVLAIPPEENSFSQKKPLPIEWAGLRDKELSKVTGEPSIFCHKNRFIAVFHTREAALNSMRKFNLM
jgi:uncharacterized UPF0160 family protein